jgi:ribosomal protein S21
MAQVIVTEEKGFDQALRDFHRKVQEQGTIKEIRRRSFFVPAAEARKLKGIEARKRNRPGFRLSPACVPPPFPLHLTYALRPSPPGRSPHAFSGRVHPCRARHN